MTPRQIILIQESFEALVPIADDAAKLFYKKLFELNPGLKPLFPNDMKEQGKKLMATIQILVLSLKNFERVIPVVEDLGRRHVTYGVKEKDYDTVAEALFWTLGQGLGEAFTDEVRYAWSELYIVLSMTMKEAAAGAQV